MNDGSRLGDRPEAVAKHEQVGHEQKHGDPNQRRNTDGGAVGAGEHQTASSEWKLELELEARTGMASAALNSNPSGASELGGRRFCGWSGLGEWGQSEWGQSIRIHTSDCGFSTHATGSLWEREC